MWLSNSPEIALPWQKETHFFQDSSKFEKGEAWYFSNFKTLSSQTKILGEVDPEYLYFPECDARIATFTSCQKFIVLLREPVARARSHYEMSRRRGYETLEFSDALHKERLRISQGDDFSRSHFSYLGRSLYARQISRMKRAFPLSDFLVLIFEDIFATQEGADEALDKICRFLGADRSLITVNFEERENAASQPRSVALRDFLYGHGRIKKTIGKTIPSEDLRRRIIMYLDKLNGRVVRTPPQQRGPESVAEEIPGFVYEALIRDLLELEGVVDIDFSRWHRPYTQSLNRINARK